MKYDFFAYINRLKYIKRWSLMRSNYEENVLEHTSQVVIVTHALATIKNKLFGGNVDVLKAVLYAEYHETGEVITGDMPTPIKYFNAQINSAYKDIERGACVKLLNSLPNEIKGEYEQYVIPNEESEEYKIMKCADTICAYIKCEEELKLGNTEFKKAQESIYNKLLKIDREEVKYFIKEVLPVYSLTLDELE
ncbi:MAG: 5'-deoxynucleotidase [Clostridia bacterium]|nr:5'-deoxynucleotidase [Clostridia bacterium]